MDSARKSQSFRELGMRDKEAQSIVAQATIGYATKHQLGAVASTPPSGRSPLNKLVVVSLVSIFILRDSG